MDRRAKAIYRQLVESIELLRKENDSLFKKVRKSKFQILKLLIKIVEGIDPYTKGHSLKVYRYVIKTAKRLGVDKREIDIISKAALLHDIGKIAIDRNILLKKGKLTEEEFAEVKIHPSIGAEIVKQVDSLNTTSPHILYHHTKFSGGGYPKNGLKYEEIPLGARLIAVADSYDAMTSDRPYRKAYSEEYAIEELRRYAGELYDPNIVEVFMEVLNEEKIS